MFCEPSHQVLILRRERRKFNRVVETWNCLLLSIREATSVNIFKALVRKFFYGLVLYLNDCFFFCLFCLFFVPLVFCYNVESLTLLH